MYVILGASGNTGHIVAKTLLSRGKKVRAVARNAAHLQSLAALGAEAFVADITDAPAITKAFAQADSAYVLVPPDLASKDYRAFQSRVVESITAALEASEINNVVALSSIGADKPSGTGPVVGLHDFEQRLNQTRVPNILSLRAGYFMENTLPQAPVVRMMGSMIGPVRPDLKLPMIAAPDIGAAAGDALSELSFRGKQTLELHGQRDLDYNEVAAIIGKSIGKPKLGYVHAPNDQLRPAMVKMGMPENLVNLILEMAAALNSGYMRPLEPRSPRTTTPTPFETFAAQSFVPAYQQQVAA